MTDALRRWLLIAGVALLVLGSTGFAPALSRSVEAGTNANQSDPEAALLFHRGCSLLILLLGVGMIVGARMPAMPKAVLGLGTFSLVIVTIASFMPYLSSASRFDPFTLCTMLARLLLGPGVTLLWGTALLRRTDPGDPGTQKVGRIGAGLVQLGFIFVFIAELRSFDGSSIGDAAGGDSLAMLLGLQRIVGLADRILLLWASIESVRTCADAEAVRARALKIHKLMLAWFGLTALLALLGIGMTRAIHQNILAGVWNSVSYWILPPAVVLVVAGRFARSYKSEAAAHP